MALKALIFDVDGTLADTERDGHRPAFNRAFQEFGLEWYWDEALYGELLAVTGGKERIRFYVERYQPSVAEEATYDAMVSELHRIKTRYYNELLSAGQVPLRPGVERLLREARDSGLRLAVATTTTPENVISLLRYSLSPDADSWFDVIAAGDIVPAKKPAPDIYHYALQELGLDAAECLAFEDSENGLKASLGAGLRTIVTVNGYTEDQNFAGALSVLTDLGDPGAPCRHLGGMPAAECVTLAELQRWTA